MVRARRVGPTGLQLALAGALLLVLAGVVLLAAIHAKGLGVADDAFITYRMAQNLGDGYGMRFNEGGPPVEAASTFLLTVMLAGAHLLGLSLIQTSVVIALLACGLTLVLLARCVWRSVGPFGLLAPAALATMSILASNVTNGLETCLLTFLLLAAAATYVAAEEGRPRLLPASSALLALVSLTRPEGPMYILAIGVLRLFDVARARAAGRPWPIALAPRSQAAWAAGFVAIYLPYTIWRLAYFGMLLPNTYHAKELQFIELSKLHAGALYLWVMMLEQPALVLALALGLAAQAIAPDRRMRALLALVLTQCIFMVLSGGDWPHMFGFGRFLMPAVPLLLWIAAESIARLVKLRRRPAAAALLLGLLGLSQLDLVDAVGMDLPVHYHYRAHAAPTSEALRTAYLRELPHMPRDEWWQRSTQTLALSRYHNNFDAVVGLWLRQRYGPRVRIASIQAGQFAFWSGMPFFDMFGLVSPEVTRQGPAHMARLLREFDPRLIAFYKWSSEVHHPHLVHEGFLGQAGYGLRHVFIRGRSWAFVVFEKGHAGEEDPREVLFATMEDLPYRVGRDKLIVALDTNHPRL